MKSACSLWKLVGTCFYAIYALGIGPARFPIVFKLLGKVASSLVGANRFDPRWEESLSISQSEAEGLRMMIEAVLSFPTVTFQSRSTPGAFTFTDAFNLGLGAVICYDDKVLIFARKWNLAEGTLTINSKEVIAAGFGVFRARSLIPDVLILLGVDNSAAFFDIINGYSKERMANQYVKSIRTGGNLGFIWIPTEPMPADGPSRFVEDRQIRWKAATILNHTLRYVFLHVMI